MHLKNDLFQTPFDLLSCFSDRSWELHIEAQLQQEVFAEEEFARRRGQGFEPGQGQLGGQREQEEQVFIGNLSRWAWRARHQLARQTMNLTLSSSDYSSYRPFRYSRETASVDRNQTSTSSSGGNSAFGGSSLYSSYSSNSPVMLFSSAGGFTR